MSGKTSLIIVIIIIVIGVIWWVVQSGKAPEEVSTFEECVAAGYSVTETEPRQCETPDGTVFIEEVEEKCLGLAGTAMTLTEANEIAAASDCMQEGTLTETSVCNATTGSWEIDVTPTVEQEGCSPACVVNAEAKTATLDWRCTGAEGE